MLITVSLISGQPKTLGQSNASPLEIRCGWFSNPTPANTFLYDRDGQWTIEMQGGYQVAGNWDSPNFKPGQWVGTRPGVSDYGYGCACLQVRVNKKTQQVSEIKRSIAKPLAACRQDPALRKWRQTFQ
ncbi:MAG: DUF4087 domain-containing protein [Tildeniella nuda ZEHNDER 1965/U140]|nr:DUF4087 domain-containing protein [Tildeniella nuda ZEHNDER 1965/U140]